MWSDAKSRSWQTSHNKTKGKADLNNREHIEERLYKVEIDEKIFLLRFSAISHT